MSKKALKAVKKKFKKQIIDTHNDFGDETIILERDALEECAYFLRDDPKLAFEMLIDITVVDYLGVKEPRFEVVYHFLSLEHRHRLRIKVPVTEDDPRVPTLSEVWPNADWGEREAYDMYGVTFDGHPDLRRILLYEEFEGYPLRKDYPIHGSQPRMPLLDVERPTTNMYSPNFGEYGPEKENR